MALLEWSLLTALLLAFLVFVLTPLRPQMVFYPLAREAARAKMSYESRDMPVLETDHFVIRYSPPDAETVAMVAQGAEAAYSPVTQALGYSPREKTLIVLYPDRSSLNKTFGWSGDQSAMGVYWGGVIQILSPHSWFKGPADDYIRSGPMVHEFTHLIFDHVTRGNYPRWFTEGMAQYMEYKVNGYEWRTENNSLSRPLYSMDELEQNFDALPNQALAYRESLAAVRYIAAVHGEEKLRQVTGGLAAGLAIDGAIAEALGMDYAAFTAAWPQWAKEQLTDE